jgi:hypothetical protein
MAQQHWGGHCTACGKSAMFIRDVEECNHLVHAFATLFLCGLWLPVWALDAARNRPCGPWLCSQCGRPWGGHSSDPRVGDDPFRPVVLAEPIESPPKVH